MVEATESRNNGVVVLLVGLPACGKSTLAARLETSANTQVKRISLDEVQAELVAAGDKDGVEAWHESKKLALERTRAFLTAPATDNEAARIVVVDDTFEYNSMRKVYYQLARELQVGYVEVHI